MAGDSAILQLPGGRSAAIAARGFAICGVQTTLFQNFGSSQTWLFAIFALFCALLRPFGLSCALLCTCVCAQTYVGAGWACDSQIAAG